MRIHRDICQKTTSQTVPDPYWMETLDGIQHHEHQKIPKDGWFVNLKIAGSISTNTMEKTVSWNVGPHGYQRGKEIHKIFEHEPP